MAAPVVIGGAGAGARATNAVMMIVVIACAALAAAAGYGLARQQAPTPDEMMRYQQLAAADGYRAGEMQGINQGRRAAIASNRRIAQYKAAIARERAWNRGYAQGKRQGLTTPRRTYNRPSYGYSAPRRYYGASTYRQTSQALAAAQAHANRTGAPVDVEIYR